MRAAPVWAALVWACGLLLAACLAHAGLGNPYAPFQARAAAPRPAGVTGTHSSPLRHTHWRARAAVASICGRGGEGLDKADIIYKPINQVNTPVPGPLPHTLQRRL